MGWFGLVNRFVSFRFHFLFFYGTGAEDVVGTQEPQEDLEAETSRDSPAGRPGSSGAIAAAGRVRRRQLYLCLSYPKSNTNWDEPI